MTRPAGKPQGSASSVELQFSVEAGDWGEEAELQGLARLSVEAALAEAGYSTDTRSELSIVLTDDANIRRLNAAWRGKDSATNVLSFPAFSLAAGDPLPPMLGDIVLARETILRESALEERPFEHHFCHLVVHGLLHLLGHDHEDEQEAEKMEALERSALARLAIPDPYA